MLNTDISYCLLMTKNLNICQKCKRNLGNYSESEIDEATKNKPLTYFVPKIGKNCKMFLELKNGNN